MKIMGEVSFKYPMLYHRRRSLTSLTFTPDSVGMITLRAEVSLLYGFSVYEVNTGRKQTNYATDKPRERLRKR